MDKWMYQWHSNRGAEILPPKPPPFLYRYRKASAEYPYHACRQRTEPNESERINKDIDVALI